MALVHFDGFEMFDIISERPELYRASIFNKTNQWQPIFNPGINGNYAALAENAQLFFRKNLNLKKGIVSFLTYEINSLDNHTLGSTLVGVMDHDSQIVSIRRAGIVNQFPNFYLIFELFVAGVQVGTFSFYNFEEWERWALVWDATGDKVKASLYRQGELIISGEGGAIVPENIDASYSIVTINKTQAVTVKVNGVQQLSYTHSASQKTIRNIEATIGDEVEIYHSSWEGRTCLLTRKHGYGDILINKGGTGAQSYIISADKESYTTSNNPTHLLIETRRVGNSRGRLDSITVWDDPIADLEDAINPHWIQAYRPAAPTGSTYNSWASFSGMSTPSNAIYSSLYTDDNNYGVRVEEPEVPLEITFEVPKLLSDIGNASKIFGFRQYYTGLSTDAMPNLGVSIKSGEAESAQIIHNTTKKIYELTYHTIDPTTGLPWGDVEYAEEVPAPDIFSDVNWVIKDEDTTTKLYFGSQELFENKIAAYPSLDGGLTVDMLMTGGSNSVRYEAPYIYRDFTVPDGFDVMNITFEYIGASYYDQINIYLFDPEGVEMPNGGRIRDLNYLTIPGKIEDIYLSQNGTESATEPRVWSLKERAVIPNKTYRLVFLFGINFYYGKPEPTIYYPMIGPVTFEFISSAAASSKTVFRAKL